MDPVSNKELISAFNGDLEHDSIPDLDKVNWAALDYLGWIHPAGHTGYITLVSPNDGCLKGATMRRYPFSNRRQGVVMCSMCHHMHQSNGTAMFSLTRKGSDGRHTLGNVVCKDLDCSLRVRDLISPATYYQEKMYVEAKIWRMQQRVHKWLRRADII
jgi:hypothetical protein